MSLKKYMIKNEKKMKRNCHTSLKRIEKNLLKKIEDEMIYDYFLYKE